MKSRATLAQSFRFAWAGLMAFLRHDRNGRIEAGIALVAGILCFWYRVSALEACLVLLCSAAVLSAEAMNAALETLADAVHPKQSLAIGKAKDLAAAAVLILAGFSAIIGLFIFGPRLLASAGVL
jgi:diacylglycerol kinase